MLNSILFSAKVLTRVQYILIFAVSAAVILALLVVIWLASYKAKKKKFLRKSAEAAKAVVEARPQRAAAEEIPEAVSPELESGPEPVPTEDAANVNSSRGGGIKAASDDDDRISALKAEIEGLKSSLTQQRLKQQPSVAEDFKTLEDELYRAQEQYAALGAQIDVAAGDGERLDLYICRIDLLEKIMQLSSGIDRLKRLQESARPERTVYFRLLDQVRRLNDRIDELENKNEGYLPGGDYYTGKYRPNR